MSNTKVAKSNIVARPPVVAIMGHIDHGKSTLLDYIRNTNIVAKEAGGITQKISAYEVNHKDDKGVNRKITFLDTPGHAAFAEMRERGARVADIAILIVSAEDGVKPQTLEAWKAIETSKTPCIVAINKIDKEGANIEKTKAGLAEHEIFLENYGGKIPCALISAKSGKGVDELLTLINILAEVENFSGDTSLPAEGFVLEADLDSKRGIQATLIIKNGSIKKGMVVATKSSMVGTRIMEDFAGRSISEATFSSPIRLVGFDKIPEVGCAWMAFNKKDEAMEYIKNSKSTNDNKSNQEETESNNKKIIPVVLKADSIGSLEAIIREMEKIQSESAEFKIVWKGAGPITEGDIKYLNEGENAVVIGFNVSADSIASDLALRKGITIHYFDIIYKLTEYLAEQMEVLRPRIESEEIMGQLKVMKTFNRTKDRQVVGGKVVEGKILMKEMVRIMRRDFEVGRGRIVNLEKNKIKVGEVEEGGECGMMVESKIEVAPGDILISVKNIKR